MKFKDSVKLKVNNHANYMEIVEYLLNSEEKLKQGYNSTAFKYILDNSKLIKTVLNAVNSLLFVKKGDAISYLGKNYIVSEIMLNYNKTNEELKVNQIITTCKKTIHPNDFENVIKLN